MSGGVGGWADTWQHLGEYFAAVERLLRPQGIFVMEAITTPEARYKEYLKVW